ncbi:MAG: succinate CoA transferase [Bacteroidales bacterium]|jgi:succinate CoA transferase|nr:succinate CoA transferase [Bacteroidales bacterium]
MSIPVITAEEAAAHINNGFNVGVSGFTAVGCPKAIGKAIAARAQAAHAAGQEFKINLFTGASTGDSLDGVLSRANAMNLRTPYQSYKDSRAAINERRVNYFDYHLSQLAQDLRYGFFGKMNVAVLEVCDYNENGEVVLTSAVGNAPTFAKLADIIILEHNQRRSKDLRGLHDIYMPLDPPNRREIPLYTPSDKIGSPVLQVDPKKIIGVIKTDLPDEIGGFTPIDETTMKIGENVANFLATEIKRGTIPASFLPIQSGVGNIANAVLACMGSNPGIPPFEMFTEVIQDAVIGLLESGDIKFASGSSLTLSNDLMEKVYGNLDFFKPRLTLRPQEVSNSPELARRMGLISINTAIEADIYGNINSTHIMGTKMMNGIGGSGDFTRNAYMSIFTTPSVAKNGAISAFVPMVSHVDHTEHSVKIIVSEFGVADLRGKSPIQRAEEIIDKVVHPEYKELLWDYIKMCKSGSHTSHLMSSALKMHDEFILSGDMRNTKWE